MNTTTKLARASVAIATFAGAATMAGWSGRTLRRNGGDGRAAELQRLDAEFHSRLHTQIEAARRYDRRFTVTSTDLNCPDAAGVALECAEKIRTLDAVTLIDGRLVTLWWNADRSGAAAAITRLTTEGLVPADSGQRTGAATFPADGLTALSLVEAAAHPDRTLAGAALRNFRVVSDRAATHPGEIARSDESDDRQKLAAH